MANHVERTILHCDMNNFFASVEQRLHPEYVGRPLAVCGNPELRHGIILAKNYEAKAYGVQTAEPVWQAKSKCPDLVLVSPHYEEYVKASKAVYAIYCDFTDLVESFSIDECWLDVTASRSLFGSGVEIADKIRARVKHDLGLTISVGVSFTKVLAKLGSDLKKPDATTLLDKQHYMSVIGSLPPSELIMIGSSSSKKLEQLNVHTIYELAHADRALLRQHFGVIADAMVDAACGKSDDVVCSSSSTRTPKSISNGTTTPRDMVTLDDAKIVVYALSEFVAMRMRRYSLLAEGVSLSVRTPDLNGYTKQSTLPFATSNASDLAEAALRLLCANHTFPSPIRALTVGAIRLIPSECGQLSIFENDNEKENKLESAVDQIRQKYGYNALKRGILIDNDIVKNLHEEDGFEPFHKN